MDSGCIKYISGILVCTITGIVIYSSLTDHRHLEHLPHQEFQTTPIKTVTTVSGTISGASGSMIQNLDSLGTFIPTKN